MKRKSGLQIIAAIFLAGMFFSCQKQEIDNQLSDSVVLDAEIEAMFDDILAEVDEFSFLDGLKNASEYLNTGNSGSRNVETTFSEDTVIHVITFDNFIHFKDPKGRIKNGSMIVKVVGRPPLPKFWRQVSFDNFTVNDVLFEGTKVIEKTEQHTFNISLADGKISFPDGKVCTREFNRVRTWIAGYDTPRVIWDDAFSVTGETQGINCNGKSYIHTITTPLIHERSCRWIVEGVVSSVVDDTDILLDYGNGECDDLATVTIDGEIKTIKLGPKP